jgi:phage shock protein A
MFKTLLLLIRGSAASAAEELADRNALLILDQQMREAGAAIERAKRALALAIAQDGAEAKHLDAAIARIADLEVRVKAALEAGNEGIAREGAEAIAALEAERDAAQAARTLFASEIARLRTIVTQAEQRLTALDRGRRVARAAESVRTMRKTPIEESGPRESTLSEAEATLQRLRERQAESIAADDALAQLDAALNPIDVAERMAAQGFGPRLKTTADDVLARLRASAP